MAGDPDDDESTLFREAVRGVRPLGTQGRAAPTRTARPSPRPPQRPRRVLLDESATAPVARASTDPMTFRRPGTPEATMRRLRRGQIPVEAEIDLHGLTGAQGERALREFLEQAIGAGMRCVRVVHGKGLRSGDRGPVLRDVSHALLRKTGQVLAYVAASAAEGGQGAVRVLLAARPR